MIIGYMRIAKKPAQLAKLTAMLCKSQGINLLYIRPDNVDIDKNIVKGELFDGTNWIEVETVIPFLIDINPSCFRKMNQSIANHLRNHTYFTYDIRGNLNKHSLIDELKKDDKFSHLVIPTRKVKTFDDILEFLNQHKSIVLKPINSDKGRGVYKLRKNEETYILSYLKNEQKLQREELEEYFNKFIRRKNYIVQKYISSINKNGDPFDCRVHVQKNGDGKWVVARNYIRVGIGQKVISNVNQGGGISDLVPFLKANFGDQWKQINRKINWLAATLPYKCEELKGTPTMSLGFDVAIDENGELYLFESNGAPAVKPVLAKTSLLRVEYYQYMIENVVDKEKIKEVNKQQSNLLTRLKQGVDYEDYNAVLAERDYYRESYYNIKNSIS